MHFIPISFKALEGRIVPLLRMTGDVVRRSGLHDGGLDGLTDWRGMKYRMTGSDYGCRFRISG